LACALSVLIVIWLLASDAPCEIQDITINVKQATVLPSGHLQFAVYDNSNFYFLQNYSLHLEQSR